MQKFENKFRDICINGFQDDETKEELKKMLDNQLGRNIFLIFINTLIRKAKPDNKCNFYESKIDNLYKLIIRSDIQEIERIKGISYISLASKNGRLDVVKFLISNNFSEFKNNNFLDTIDWTIVGGQLEVLKYLLNLGIEPYEKDIDLLKKKENKLSAIMIASIFGHLEIIEYIYELVEKKYSNENIPENYESYLYDITNYSPNIIYYNGLGCFMKMNSLLCACLNGHLKIVKYLITKGGELILYHNRFSGINLYQTGLHLTVEGSRFDVLSYIIQIHEKKLELKNIINSRNIRGETPLKIAIVKCRMKEEKVRLDIITLLLQKKADMNEKCAFINGCYEYPLKHVCNFNRKNILKVLLKYEPDNLLSETIRFQTFNKCKNEEIRTILKEHYKKKMYLKFLIINKFIKNKNISELIIKYLLVEYK